MREILFRGKREDDGKWVYGYYGEFHNRPLVDGPNICQIFEPCEIESKLFNSMIGGIWHHIDRETVGQFTGLTDKNGTKIFEGDIVKLTEKNDKYEWVAVVEFGNPNSYYSWGWQLKPITKNVEYNLDILCWVDIDDFGVYCEVIGNIYDNPELLKGGAE